MAQPSRSTSDRLYLEQLFSWEPLPADGALATRCVREALGSILVAAFLCVGKATLGQLKTEGPSVAGSDLVDDADRRITRRAL